MGHASSLHVRFLFLLGFLGSLLIGGCAAPIKLDAATDLSKSISLSAEKTNAYLADVKYRDSEAKILLIASDPSCVPGKAILLRVPTDLTLPPGALCAAQGSPPEPGFQIVRYSVLPISDSALKPTLTAISALTSYGEVLANILNEKAPTPGADLAAALGKINTAFAEAQGVASFAVDIPDNPLASAAAKKQVAAIGALLDFISVIAAENRKVKDIEAVVARDGAKVSDNVARLKELVDDWFRTDRTSVQITINNYERMFASDILSPKKAKFNDPVSRATALRSLMLARAQLEKLPKLQEALVDLLDIIPQAQSTLNDKLAGKLTPEDRARAQRIFLDRLWAGVRKLSGLLGAF